ncbi:hypothetical protein GLYMA_02G184400v4 [Glycine max]|uniref:26S proteasome non-ATPase regulatory subunit 1/RPN2 N-terminal domain-containing protein n=1 Tax=Glycine max TaxID=3847 RepID=K7K9C7_SOYBN|nr:hypothetical protein GYH30_004450 [Glycine max]KRH72001.1 hypothetical protein GLYMA_02G184400v4 [Glycine max]
MATTLVSSVGGMLAMLNEPHLSVKLHALSNLNNLVETFWPPLVDSLNYAVCIFQGNPETQGLKATSANINNDQFGHKFEISCKAPMKKGGEINKNK